MHLLLLLLLLPVCRFDFLGQSLCLNLSCLFELFRHRFWRCQRLGRFYYVCHLILILFFFFMCSLLNFSDMSKHSLVSSFVVVVAGLGEGRGGGGRYFFFFFFFFFFCWMENM